MDQYRPQYNAWDYEYINRSLKREEFNEAFEYAKEVIGKEFLEPNYE